MRHTLFFVLPLFLLNTLLYCEHTQDAELTLAPNTSHLFNGEFVTFVCDMREEPDTDWQYRFNRNGQQMFSFNTNNAHSLQLTPDLSGDYQCIGRHKSSTEIKKQSNNVTLSVSAHRPRPTLRADRTAIPVGGAVILTCSVEGSAGWKYEWFRRTSDPDEEMVIADGNRMENLISISQAGIYWCQGRRGNPVFFTEQSDVFRIEITLPNRIFVTLQHNWTQIFSGETFAVICQVVGGGDTEWEYEWRTTSPNTPPTQSEYRISHASVSHSGQYWCKGRNGQYSSTEWSVPLPLRVSSNKPRPTVTANRQTIPVDGDGTLICSVEDPAEWKYYWFRRASVFSESQLIRDGEPNRVISISHGGIYSCKGGRGNPVFFTEDSDVLTIEKRVSDKAVVSLQPNWPLIFDGETITVRCDIHRLSEFEYVRMDYIDFELEYENTEWEYEWSSPNSDTVPTSDEYKIRSAAVSNSGNYRCMGKLRQDLYSSTEWSDVITLTVSSNRPKAELRADDRDSPVGGSVTLTCSVNPSSSGWKYFWYRGEKTSEPLTSELSAGPIRVSEEGVYWCRGGRGEPVYYTEYSDAVTINKKVTNMAVLTLRPNWSRIYSGETITLRCEIQGGDTEWEYEWTTTSSHRPQNVNEYWITSASLSDSGDYWCKGRTRRRAQQNSTGWSNSLKLTASDTLQPVLTVSPSWLSAGASVTLKCEVEHPSEGWRFYWYKTVPDLSDNSYSYELLPGNSSGTEQDFYIVHGQTHTAGFMCRAGRGDPVLFTQDSEAMFVWSGDFHSSASLTVSPDRAQHFTSDSVSLSCEGNSTEWRVMRLPEYRHLSDCTIWGTMNGSTCNMDGWHSDAVYWCESGSGEFSNAVNITTGFGIILVSPVHPVTEGDSVTLGCNLETEELLSNVTFYKNNELIRNDYSAELNISEVSESDEGFYRCEYSGVVSPESWMPVKSFNSPFPVPLIAGLVVGILLIVPLPLLLLCWYRKSKDTWCHRVIMCQGTNQSSATVRTVNRDENQQQVYSSLLHGDVCVYETISGPGNAGSGERSDEYRHVTSQIELKGLGKWGIRDDSAESSDYSNVNPDSTGS